MIKEIYHVGLSVSDIDRSIDFYKNILGLEFQGEILMEGEATDKLFNRPNSRCRVAYLNGSKEVMAPPVELICFLDQSLDENKASLFKPSISEICFRVNDIDKVYKHLIDNGVECLSAPQEFDFSKSGFSKSKALYFKDPDGIILELMESLD